MSPTRERPGGAGAPIRALLVCISTACLAGACREGTLAASFAPIPASAVGSQGCDATRPALLPAPAPVDLAALPAPVGPLSRILAARAPNAGGRCELFLTAGDASLWRLEFDPGAPDLPVAVTRIFDADDVRALPGFGMAAQPELSGMTLLEDLNSVLVAVVEHSRHTLLLAECSPVPSVGLFPGLVPDQTPGFADSTQLTPPRFHFAVPAQPVATGDGRIFLPDPGNHALRVLDASSAPPVVLTVAGNGAPGFQDGRLGQTLFDTPVAAVVSCTGTLLTGDFGGNRVRSLALGFEDFFGFPDGLSETLAGDGTDASTEGPGPTASSAGPDALVTTDDGRVFWMDARTGVLRRLDAATGTVDCPLAPGCVNPGVFSAPGSFSLAVSADGVLYVLDATAGALFRVSEVP